LSAFNVSSAQLDQFRLLFFGRQGRQMQFVIDAQFTGLDLPAGEGIKITVWQS
jgi:hypothetical protein